MAHTASSLFDVDGKTGDAARELARRRADLIRHARGSLEQHLTGVYRVLEGWKQPERVVRAGLLHSAYSTEAFGHCLFARRERARVRELVGPDAEHLVFAFSGCKRDALLAAARHAAGPVDVETRWRGNTVRVTPRDLAELMVIHAANLAEQASLPRGSPSRWLAAASQLLAAAREGVETAPPVFAGCGEIMTPDEEASLLTSYRALLPRTPDSTPVLDGPGGKERAITSSPVGEPFAIAGMWALAGHRGADAATLGERALAAFDAWGVAWDKRLEISRWRQLARALVRDGTTRDRELEVSARRAMTVMEAARGSPERIWAQMDALHALCDEPAAVSVASRARKKRASPGIPARFAQYLGGLRTNAERPMLQFYPGLSVKPWHDPRAFAIVADLERLAPEIAREASALGSERFQDEAEDIERDGRWSVLFLLEMGRRNEENLARCPATRSILEKHRTLTTHAGLMYFSCLDPRTRVAPHRGPTNVRLRCHLGLEVPSECGIRVGGVSGRWEEGRCLVFDDSFSHEVWNESDRRRVVLVLDLWHPDLDDDEVSLLAGLHRYGAANGSSAEKYWARNDAARNRARGSRGGAGDAGDARALDGMISRAMRAGNLAVASGHAARYAELCRGTRWYPAPRENDPELPPTIAWERVLTPAKLLHDIEQLEYLMERKILGPELQPIVEQYDGVLDTLRPLGPNARVPLQGDLEAKLGHVYNRLVHVRSAPRLPRALSREWEAAAAESEYLDAKPSVIVVDDFLTKDAIESLRLFSLESTIWSTNRYDHGRLGSFFRDGFNCPLLVQIAEELQAAFPRILGSRHPVTQVWGFKYATIQPSLPAHADFAAVNVNFWITPDAANLEPDGGGLVLYDVDAPRDWDFATYNRNAKKIGEYLAARNGTPRHIPHRYNRAVIFDSDLFHTTPALRFQSGYENRRVNVTFLFGDRRG